MISLSTKVIGQGALVEALDKIVGNAFDIIDGYTKATLPEAINNETPIRTGELRRGNMVDVSHSGHQLTVHFENNVLYAPFVINGTYKMRANNYVERAAQRYQAKLDFYTKDWLSKL